MLDPERDLWLPGARGLVVQSLKDVILCRILVWGMGCIGFRV